MAELGADFRVERSIECFLNVADEVDRVAKIHRVEGNGLEIATEIDFQLRFVVGFVDELSGVLEDLLRFRKDVGRGVCHQSSVLPFVLAVLVRVRLVVGIAVVLVGEAVEAALVGAVASLGIVVVVVVMMVRVVRD